MISSLYCILLVYSPVVWDVVISYLLWFFACFRHADVLACFQWFCGVCLVLVCVLVGFGVSLSLAAQRGWFSSVEVDGPAGVVVV